MTLKAPNKNMCFQRDILEIPCEDPDKKSLLSNWWQCYNRENWKFPRKTSKISVFWTGSNVKAAKTGKISQKPRKIFVLRIILSDRKIYVKNSAVFCRNIPQRPNNCFKSLFPTVKL